MTSRVDASACPVPFWLPDGHAQTLYGALFARYHRIAFVRERLRTPDGDFLDIDWTAPCLFPDRLADGGSARQESRLAGLAARRWLREDDRPGLAAMDAPALVLFHGLEGSSQSPYAQAIAHHFRARGWVVAIAHFRGCSGFPNRMARAYYSGDAADVACVIEAVRQRAPLARWHAAGVSLGGNALLRLLGEAGANAPALAACAAVSVPMDLLVCGRQLSEPWLQRHLYSRHFLRTMKPKVLDKSRRFPGTIDTLRLSQARSLREFDDLYTAPMHGYKHALDYWTRASSKPLLRDIRVPTLILNARNDPFVPAPSLPGSAECSSDVLLHQPAQGGHAMFVTGRFPGHLRWLPERLALYFETGN